MNEGTQTAETSQTAAETPSDEVETEVAETETEAEAVEDSESESSEPIDELEDVEWQGKKYKLPKEIKPALMMQADYTRKTQEVAEQRKALEAQYAQQAEAQQHHVRDIGRVMHLSEELAELEKIDWQRLEAEDPMRAQSLFRDYTLKKGQRDALVQEIQHKEAQRVTEQQQTIAKQYSETTDTLNREIPGWDKSAKDVAKFALSSGITQQELQHIALSVPLSKLLHKAWLGEQVVNKQKAAAQKAKAEETPSPEPVRQVAKGTGKVSSALRDDLSTQEWVRRRNAQIRSRA